MTTQSQTEALKLIADIASGSTTANSLQNIAKIAQEALAQPDYEKAYIAWQEKTEWVQETVKPHELGMHRADVLKQRIEALAQQSNEQGCEHCNHSLYCGTKCKNCGKQSNEQVEPVAWRAWFDADNSAKWLFTLWPEEEHPSFDWQPLYTHPPVPTAQPEQGPNLAEAYRTELDKLSQRNYELRMENAKLKQPKEPEQEPKCIGKAWAMWGGPVVFDPPLTQTEQRSVNEHLEPVAWKLVPVKPTREIEDAIGNARNLKASEIWEDALTAVSAPPQRKPLTDEQIYQMWTDEGLANSYDIYSLKEHVRRAARAIEAAHGIKE